MTWLTRYRAKEFVRSSFWLFPSLAIFGAWLFAKLILWFVPDPHWPRFDEADIDGMRTSMAAFASSMLTFVVYAVSALLLAVQLASGQITPRLIRLTFSRWQMKFSTSVFVFAFGITMVVLANLSGRVAAIRFSSSAAIAGNIASVLVFFWFVQEVGLGLRPVAVLQQIFGRGKGGLDSVYERAVRCIGPAERWRGRPAPRGKAVSSGGSDPPGPFLPSAAGISWPWQLAPTARSN